MNRYFVAVAIFASANVMASPLGLHMGMNLEELKKQGDFVPKQSPFFYSAKTIANGHSDFETYTVILTPKQGLCRIQANGKFVETSSFGTELIRAQKSLVEDLSVKYGAPLDNHDFLRAGSSWKESKYWMMGLLKRERVLNTFWSTTGNKNLPDSVRSIAVDTLAHSGNRGSIQLTYEFNNFDACLEVIRAKKSSNL